MPWHDAVGINCIKGATTEKNQAQMSRLWAKGVFSAGHYRDILSR